MVEHRAIPRTDVFSLTCRGSPWVNTYWLQEIPNYLIYRRLGLLGFTLFNSFLIATIILLVGFANHGRATSWKFRLASMVWIFLAAQPRGYGWGEKASLVTFGFLGLLFYTLRSGKWPTESRLGKAWPFLFVIWANAHRGFILGLLILAGYVLERCITSKTDRSPIFWWGFSCVVTTLLNPWGLRIYGMSWHDFRLSPNLVRGWAQTPFLHLEIFWITLVLFWILMGWEFWHGNFPGFAFTWASALLSVLSMRYASFYPYFILWAVPWLISIINRKVPVYAINWIPALTGAVILLSSLDIHPAVGVNGSIFPTEAVRFLKESDLRHPFYHDYGLGGYYLWELDGKPPVLIDGRYPAVEGYRELLPAMDKSIQGTPDDFHRFLNRLDIHSAVVAYPSTGFLRRPFALYFPRSQWALLYWDDLVLVFAQRIPPLQNQIQKYEFAGIEPDSDPVFWRQTVWSRLSAGQKASLRQEFERNARLRPDSRRARFWQEFTR